MSDDIPSVLEVAFTDGYLTGQLHERSVRNALPNDPSTQILTNQAVLEAEISRLKSAQHPWALLSEVERLENVITHWKNQYGILAERHAAEGEVVWARVEDLELKLKTSREESRELVEALEDWQSCSIYREEECVGKVLDAFTKFKGDRRE